MTTEHLLIINAINGVSCSCNYFGTPAALTRHLLEVGRNEGRQEGYDSGYEIGYGDGETNTTLLIKGELVTADDSRVKPGARVRVEFDIDGTTMTREGLVKGWDPYRTGKIRLLAGGGIVEGATRIYLLAEAPSPDAEVLEAIGAADEASSTYAGKLAHLRDAGFDVVKVEEK